MEVDLAAIPDEPTLLRAAAFEVQRVARSLIVERNLLLEHIERQNRLLFGRRSERSGILGAPGQSLMGFLEGALAPLPAGSAPPLPSSSAAPEGATSLEATAEPEEKPEAKARPKHPGRRAFPADLPRQRRVIDLPPEDCRCLRCQKPMPRIGEDSSQRIEYIPASLFVDEEVRPRYACPDCKEGVLSAPPSPAPIPRGLAGPGLLSYLAVSKFEDHLPLHRLEHILARMGVEVPRSTMADWLGAVADLLAPIYDELRKVVLASAVIAADESKLPVQGEKPGRLDCSWMWVYASAERNVTIFDYARTRGSKEPLRFLDGWRGTLLTDDCGSYKPLHTRGIREAGCWAHARRKFFDAKPFDPSRSEWMIAAIARLYAIEEAVRTLSPEDRAAHRRALAAPILAEIRAWLDREARAVLPRSGIGKAIAYTRDRWAALTVYLEDGRIEIDNNRCERALRDVVIGRKNWLFAGSDAGGRRAAILFSLIATCKLHGHDPWAYLKDLLTRLPTFRGDPATLTPLVWKAPPRDESPPK